LYPSFRGAFSAQEGCLARNVFSAPRVTGTGMRMKTVDKGLWEVFFDLLLNYGPHALTAGIAIFYLIKDWKDFKAHYSRLTVLLLIILLCLVGISNTYYTNIKSEKQRVQYEKKIEILTSSVETSNRNQVENTKQFVNEFSRLSQKIVELQSEVKTTGLKEEAEKLKAELEATQRSMNPPKTKIGFTFGKGVGFDNKPIREITLPVNDDIVHVEFSVFNFTDITARNGSLALEICRECEYASEPKKFTKIDGYPQVRSLKFDQILAKTHSQLMSVDIKVPRNISTMELLLTRKCENCELEEVENNLHIVKLSR
jgi:hypothetical protein